MAKTLHLTAAIIALLTVVTCFIAPLVAWQFGSKAILAEVSQLVVIPGLLILFPALVVTGMTGGMLAKTWIGDMAERKRKRMRWIILNSLILFVPAVIFLDIRADQGAFDSRFYLLQGVALAAGALNLLLMAQNARNGRKLSVYSRAEL